MQTSLDVYNKWLAVSLLFIVMISALALPVGAAGDVSVLIKRVSYASCTPSSLVGVTAGIEVNSNSYKLVRQLSNSVRDTTTASTSSWTSGSGDFVVTASVPVNTQGGDLLNLTVAITNSNGSVLSYDQVTINCSTGEMIGREPIFDEPEPEDGDDTGGEDDGTDTGGDGDTDSPPAPPPFDGELGGQRIYPLPDSPYTLVPATNGILPCGVFWSNGWGLKQARFSDFSDCNPQSRLSVSCVNNSGGWTYEHVTGLVQNDDGISFNLEQHGHCALFEGTAPSSLLFRFMFRLIPR